jgi:hypothetical protein
MRRMMATQEPRAPGANKPIGLQRTNRRFAQCGIACEAKIIIRGEIHALWQ